MHKSSGFGEVKSTISLLITFTGVPYIMDFSVVVSFSTTSTVHQLSVSLALEA